jgi:hypothetical protein
MGEEKIHSLYLQRKDTSCHGPSVYRTVLTETSWPAYKPQHRRVGGHPEGLVEGAVAGFSLIQ